MELLATLDLAPLITERFALREIDAAVRAARGRQGIRILVGADRRHRPCNMPGMREVGLGLALERFSLVAQGEVYCVVDILEHDTASLVLSALPGFPLDVDADKARHFVSAWRQRGEMEAQSYEVREEQQEV